MGVVAGIHLAVFFFIAKGLGIVPVLTTYDGPIDTTFVDDLRPRDDPPSTLPPVVETTLHVPLPIPDTVPFDSDQERVSAEPIPIGGTGGDVGGTAVPQPEIISVRQDGRHPLSQPPYPSADIRLGNEGNADVQLYVLPNGRVGDARIVRSTGYDRLDRSALDEAKRNWRLLPATRDGVPVAQWYTVRVTFKITNR